MENTDLLAINIVNPSKIALQNQRETLQTSDGYSYPATPYTAYYSPMKFTKLSADKGVGRFLLAINKYPGCTKSKLFEKIFGPNYTGGAFAETFTKMKSAKVIENRRPGFYITPLGLAVLKQHNLI